MSGKWDPDFQLNILYNRLPIENIKIIPIGSRGRNKLNIPPNQLVVPNVEQERRVSGRGRGKQLQENKKLLSLNEPRNLSCIADFSKAEIKKELNYASEVDYPLMSVNTYQQPKPTSKQKKSSSLTTPAIQNVKPVSNNKRKDKSSDFCLRNVKRDQFNDVCMSKEVSLNELTKFQNENIKNSSDLVNQKRILNVPNHLAKSSLNFEKIEVHSDILCKENTAFFNKSNQVEIQFKNQKEESFFKEVEVDKDNVLCKEVESIMFENDNLIDLEYPNDAVNNAANNATELTSDDISGIEFLKDVDKDVVLYEKAELEMLDNNSLIDLECLSDAANDVVNDKIEIASEGISGIEFLKDVNKDVVLCEKAESEMLDNNSLIDLECLSDAANDLVNDKIEITSENISGIEFLKDVNKDVLCEEVESKMPHNDNLIDLECLNDEVNNAGNDTIELTSDDTSGIEFLKDVDKNVVLCEEIESEMFHSSNSIDREWSNEPANDAIEYISEDISSVEYLKSLLDPKYYVLIENLPQDADEINFKEEVNSFGATLLFQVHHKPKECVKIVLVKMTKKKNCDWVVSCLEGSVYTSSQKRITAHKVIDILGGRSSEENL